MYSRWSFRDLLAALAIYKHIALKNKHPNLVMASADVDLILDIFSWQISQEYVLLHYLVNFCKFKNNLQTYAI